MIDASDESLLLRITRSFRQVKTTAHEGIEGLNENTIASNVCDEEGRIVSISILIVERKVEVKQRVKKSSIVILLRVSGCSMEQVAL